MIKTKLFKRITVYTITVLLALPLTVMSQQIEESATAQGSEKVFEQEELEQMLAPIALYPDALLAQVLTAATYPLEIVEASRFIKENPGLKDEALLEAAKTKDWEPSVKAMLEFPDVLAMMDEQLEWTQKLGDAFLAQQSDCMDAIQRLRQKAYARGNLATSEKQVIRVEPQTKIIIIEPASPEVVYVPVYDPVIIYGPWWYPAYPPYYFYPRRYSGITFFSGVFVGAFWVGWGTWDCNWHSRHVYINTNHYNNFTNIHYRSGNHYRFYKDGQSVQPWRHYTQHSQRVRQINSVAPRRFSVQQRPGLTIRSNTQDIRKSNQGTIKSPTIDLRRNARPSIDTSKSSVNIQPSTRKMPARVLRENAANQANTGPTARAHSRSDAGNQGGIKASTGDLRVREFAKPPTMTESPKDSVRNQIIVRPRSDDSRHRRDNDNIAVAKSRGRIERAENDELLPNRRFAPGLKDSNVLREGFMHAGGR